MPRVRRWGVAQTLLLETLSPARAGQTVEMHGSVRELVCPECGVRVWPNPTSRNPLSRTRRADGGDARERARAGVPRVRRRQRRDAGGAARHARAAGHPLPGAGLPGRAAAHARHALRRRGWCAAPASSFTGLSRAALRNPCIVPVPVPACPLWVAEGGAPQPLQRLPLPGAGLPGRAAAHARHALRRRGGCARPCLPAA